MSTLVFMGAAFLPVIRARACGWSERKLGAVDAVAGLQFWRVSALYAGAAKAGDPAQARKMVSKQSGNYRDRANWLEDVLAGLLINGVREDEIEVQHYPDGLTRVLVRGESRYSYQIVVVGL